MVFPPALPILTTVTSIWQIKAAGSYYALKYGKHGGLVSVEDVVHLTFPS